MSATLRWPSSLSCPVSEPRAPRDEPAGSGAPHGAGQLWPFSAVIVDRNMTTADLIGSRADSPGSHTLSCTSSSCSLDYYIDAARCARKPRRKPALPTPTGRRLGRSRTLLTASHFVARAQAAGFCGKAPPPRRDAQSSARRRHPHRGAHPAQLHRRRARGGSLAVAARRRPLRRRPPPRRACVGGDFYCFCAHLVCVRVCAVCRPACRLGGLSLLACRAGGNCGLRVFSHLQIRNKN